MTTTPAAELRAAAELLRAHAAAAAENSGSTTWHSKPHFPNQLDSDFTTLTASPGRPLHGGGGGRGAAPYMHAPISEYIALMGPGVGLALADWLDSWTGVEISEHGPMPDDARHALAVARQILGTPAAPTVADTQSETEAHRPLVEYIAEVLEDDGVWMYLGADPDHGVAEKRCASVIRRHPDAQTRIVRKTTTYTVAAPAVTEGPNR